MSQSQTLVKHKKIFALFLVSFLCLFWETLFIRWIPSQLPLFAFFRNTILLACFLGLGVGCIHARRTKKKASHYLLLFYLLICVFILTLSFVGKYVKWRGFGGGRIYDSQTQEIISLGHEKEFTLEFTGAEKGGVAVILVLFMITVLIFIPLGIVLSKYFKEFSPLQAYKINILGSIFGTALFTIISFFQLQPIVWFNIGLLPGLWFFHSNSRRLKIGLSLVFMTILPFLFIDRSSHWSPYQKIDIKNQYWQDEFLAGTVFVNEEFHQLILNSPEKTLSFLPKTGIKDSFIRTTYDWNMSYEMPYGDINPRSVLVIASGVGNEVAAALRHGVEEIDAVEIDPAFFKIGQRYHPEQPYQNSRVNIIIDDARAFLQRTKKKYDLIVMHRVDAHYQFASTGGLRLDSYMYTVECFEQIKAHLKEGGKFSLVSSGYHWAIPWSRNRLLKMLEVVFGSDSWEDKDVIGGHHFIITPKEGSKVRNFTSTLLPTDDWPQFYLTYRKIPSIYWQIILLILLFSFLLLGTVVPNAITKGNLHFFFLGAGFMLLEIKSITQLMLFFGATWFVSSLVIMTVLVAILLANYFVGRHTVGLKIIYGLLFLTILLNYLIPSSRLLSFDFVPRLIFASLLLSLPIFFAGIIFAISFQKTKDSRVSLGSNFLGAMVGGLGEYASLIYGTTNLSFIVILFYFLSIVTLKGSHPRA